MKTLDVQTLAMYLGCEVQCTFPEEVVIAKLTCVTEENIAFDKNVPDYYPDAEEDENQGNGFSIKLYLRPLS